MGGFSIAMLVYQRVSIINTLWIPMFLWAVAGTAMVFHQWFMGWFSKYNHYTPILCPRDIDVKIQIHWNPHLYRLNHAQLHPINCYFHYKSQLLDRARIHLCLSLLSPGPSHLSRTFSVFFTSCFGSSALLQPGPLPTLEIRRQGGTSAN